MAVFDAFGVIQGTLRTVPTPVELDVPVNEYPPPETNNEITEMPAYHFPADLALPVHPRRPAFRPPPPFFPRPEPTAELPGYIPIPPGIRAVYTTGAALLLGQPEMNRPRRRIAPAIREGAAALGNFDIVGIARRWAIRLGHNPEINPTL